MEDPTLKCSLLTSLVQIAHKAHEQNITAYRESVERMRLTIRESSRVPVAPLAWRLTNESVLELQTRHPALEENLYTLRGHISELQFQIDLQELSTAKRALDESQQLLNVSLLDFGLPPRSAK